MPLGEPVDGFTSTLTRDAQHESEPADRDRPTPQQSKQGGVTASVVLIAESREPSRHLSNPASSRQREQVSEGQRSC